MRAVVPPLGVCDGHAQVMAGEPLELPLTATAGSQRYTVRFDHAARAVAGCSRRPPGGPLPTCSVWLRGGIGDGQQKAGTLLEFLQRHVC